MSGDVRAAVEGLRQPNATTFVDAACNSVVDRVLALIPEGAVLVTEEMLAAAIRAVDERWGDPSEAAAILRRLREGT